MQVFIGVGKQGSNYSNDVVTQLLLLSGLDRNFHCSLAFSAAVPVCIHFFFIFFLFFCASKLLFTIDVIN